MIPRNMEFITLIGDATKPPTITGNDTAAVIGRDGMPFGTFHSATVAVDANYFVAVNIKFEVPLLPQNSSFQVINHAAFIPERPSKRKQARFL